MPSTKAIFLDRDGVLNIDKGNACELESIELYAYAGDTIAQIHDLNYKVFIVTNQPVVARGWLSEKKLTEINKRYQDLLFRQNPQALVDKIYYCPHHPEATLEEYRQNCSCRKPKPGMLKKAAQEFQIDLEKSFMVGDRISDIVAGHLAGCKTILCTTGKHQEKMIVSDLKAPEVAPDFVISNLSEIKDIIS